MKNKLKAAVAAAVLGAAVTTTALTASASSAQASITPASRVPQAVAVHVGCATKPDYHRVHHGMSQERVEHVLHSYGHAYWAASGQYPSRYVIYSYPRCGHRDATHGLTVLYVKHRSGYFVLGKTWNARYIPCC